MNYTLLSLSFLLYLCMFYKISKCEIRFLKQETKNPESI